MNKEISYDQFFQNLLKDISILGGLNNFSLIIYFLAKEILLYNWLDKTSAYNFTVFNGYVELFLPFIIIAPIILPRIFQEVGQKKFHLATISTIIILIFNLLVIIFVIEFMIILGFQLNISSINESILISLLIISLILISFTQMFESIFYGLKKVKIVGIINLIISSIFILLLILFFFLGELNFLATTIILISSNIIGIFLGIFFLIKSNQIVFKKNYPLSEYYKISKRILKFGTPLMITKIFYFLNWRVGIIMLSSIKLEYPIYYHLSINIIIYFISFLSLPIINTIQPHLAEFFVNNKTIEIKKIYKFILPLITILLISSLIILYSFLPLILRILYQNYYTYVFVNLFKIVIIGGIFYCLNQFLGRFSIANGKPVINTLAQGIGGISNFIFLIISMVFSNILFSGLGFLISSFLIFIIFVIFTLKYTKLKLKESKLLIIILSSISSILIYEFIYYFTNNLYFGGILSILIFYFLIFKFKLLTLKSMKRVLKFIVNIIKGMFIKEN